MRKKSTGSHYAGSSKAAPIFARWRVFETSSRGERGMPLHRAKIEKKQADSPPFLFCLLKEDSMLVKKISRFINISPFQVC